jgi:hypothetical protein
MQGGKQAYVKVELSKATRVGRAPSRYGSCATGCRRVRTAAAFLGERG